MASVKRAIKTKLKGQTALRSHPRALADIKQKLDSGDLGSGEIGKFIGQEPPLAAYLLRQANSAMYSLSEPCWTTEGAASVLGFDALRDLVTDAPTMELDVTPERMAEAEELWVHSRLVAALCAEMPRVVEGSREFPSDMLHACGLLHDLGRFIMLDRLGNEFVEILGRGRTSGIPSDKLEKGAFEFSHTHLGDLVTSAMRLPEPVTRVNRHHHDRRGTVQTDKLVASVYVADVITQFLGEDELRRIGRHIPSRTTELLDLRPEDIEHLFEFARESRAAMRSYPDAA